MMSVSISWRLFALFLALNLYCSPLLASEIESLSELYDAIEEGPNHKVGFLSLGNFQVVRNTLPGNVEPVIVGGVDQLSAFVTNGTLLAGLVTQVPPKGFNQFPSGIISPQSIFFARNASSLLVQTIDAAVVRVIQAAGPFAFARKNPPMVVLEANSCSPDGDLYPYPTTTELLSEPWFQVGKMKVGALGPYDWGNTGNYLVSPPVGFWPDYYDAIEKELVSVYGSAGFTGLERVFFSSSDALLFALSAGTIQASEPYFVVQGVYNNRGRSASFSFSCFTFASSSTYFTKKNEQSKEVLSAGATAGVIIGGVALLVGAVFIAYMIFKERRGKPLFMPLKSHDEFDEERNLAGDRGNNEVTLRSEERVGNV